MKELPYIQQVDGGKIVTVHRHVYDYDGREIAVIGEKEIGIMKAIEECVIKECGSFDKNKLKYKYTSKVTGFIPDGYWGNND